MTEVGRDSGARVKQGLNYTAAPRQFAAMPSIFAAKPSNFRAPLRQFLPCPKFGMAIAFSVQLRASVSLESGYSGLFPPQPVTLLSGSSFLPSLLLSFFVSSSANTA